MSNKNFMANGDAETVFSGYATRIKRSPSAFIGTRAQWDALTSEQKALYQLVNINDDNEEGGGGGGGTQIQSDWAQTDNTQVDFIKNKPTIPDAQIQCDWNQNDDTAKDFIKNKPTLGTAASKNVPASGDAASTEVVLGNDSRLSDSRPASDVSAWAKQSTKPSYNYSEINNTPTLGTASAKNVPASGDASSAEVVMGNDTRLTDSRPASDVSSWAKQSTKPSYSYSEINNTPTLGTAASKDVPASGDASATQVVMGNDSRLSVATTSANGLMASADKARLDNIGESRYGGTTTTTYIKITLNMTVNPMLSFVVTIYQGYRSIKLMISGYARRTSSHWNATYCKAKILGDSDTATAPDVIFGYDSNTVLWVAIAGGSNTGVLVSDVVNGGNQITDIGGLFTIANVTELTGTSQKTVTASFTSHNQAASTIDAGTLNGKVLANATSVATLADKQVRNIYIGTAEMTPGTTELPTGDIYIQYEA